MKHEDGLSPWTTPTALGGAEAPWTGGRKVASWVWALTPVLTLGLANPAVFLFAAVRRHSWKWWLAFGAYTAVFTVLIVLAGAPDGSTEDDVFGAVAILNWAIASGHALGVRRRVFTPEATVAQEHDPALTAAMQVLERRVVARRILAQDTSLARQLAIGRPDLQRGYDDGGLIDVNTAPVALLSKLPGLGTAGAERVVEVREAAGGFVSGEEMALLADLPPSFLDTVGDQIVFSRR